MDYPPPTYQQDNGIELSDRKEQANENKSCAGYRDYEAGAPHDPSHSTVPPTIVTPPRRRRVDLSLWHVVALYGCGIFLTTTVIALVLVIATHLNCAAPSSIAGGPLNFNSSVTTTVTVTPQEPSQSTTEIATTDSTTSTTTVTSSSSHSVHIVTAPTVTVTSVTISTDVAFSTTKTHTGTA